MAENKPQINTKPMNEETTSFVVPNISTTTVAIENHMAIIRVEKTLLMMHSWMEG
jgi:hypothetical protein